MVQNLTLLIPNQWLTILGLPEFLHDSKEDVVRIVKVALMHYLDGLETPELTLGAQVEDEESELNEPLQTEPGPMCRVMFSLPQKYLAKLSKMAEKRHMSAGPLAKRMLNRMVIKHHQADNLDLDARVSADHPTAVVTRMLNEHFGSSLAPRPAQAACYDNIWECLTTGSIGLVEAGTGVGKTRAMVLASTRWVMERGANIGICAPTIALLRQFQAEYSRLSSVMEMPPLRLMIGRREFVSEVTLRELVQEAEEQAQSKGEGRIKVKLDTNAIREWMENGYLPKSQPSEDAWQVHSLLQIAPDLPSMEVSLQDLSDINDRGYKAYKAQFTLSDSDKEDEAPTPTILLFTHAMLAHDIRRKSAAAGQDETYRELNQAYFKALTGMKGKKYADSPDEIEKIALIEAELGVAFADAASDRGVLPIFTALLVDEAHMLEENFSNALAEYLSLRGLVRDLIQFKSLGGTLPQDGIGLAIDCLKKIGSQPRSKDQRDLVDLKSSVEVHSYLLILSQICQGISKVRNPESDKAKLALRLRRAGALLQLSVGRNLSHAFLQQSPVRGFPRVFISPSNVGGLLSKLWSSLDCAALVSATLYITNSDGPSGNFMANLLKVPNFKQKTFPPVYASWSTACVEGVYFPKVSGNFADSWLMPPQQKSVGSDKREIETARNLFEVDEARWHGEVSQVVKKIWCEAAGGVLVLCTSYATVEAVAASLNAGDAEIDQCLIVAVPEFSLRMQSAAFLQASHDGKRPLWIAVGSAWTGVDIGGHDPWRDRFGVEVSPDQDNVLTDLVIPRLPYGTNQSLTHLRRIRFEPHVPWDLLDAALRFKQALGRLVRRAGLPLNRRIHVLDARLNKPENRHRVAVFLNALSRYKLLVHHGLDD